MIKILCVGDIVGRSGREVIGQQIIALKKELQLDLVIANAENAAAGSGVTVKVADELFQSGCDVLTLGDHAWDKKEVISYFLENEKIMRPANFPEGTPGRGWGIYKTASGLKVGVVNLLGRVFIRYNTNCPFVELKRIVEEIKKETPVILVDFHAETTSEKVALGHFIDGSVSGVVGTHTHIQTADEKILPSGTAYITDLGMTGPYDSVIGQNKEKIIERFLTSMPTKFEVATDDVYLCGAVITIDESTGKAVAIERVQRAFS